MTLSSSKRGHATFESMSSDAEEDDDAAMPRSLPATAPLLGEVPSEDTNKSASYWSGDAAFGEG